MTRDVQAVRRLLGRLADMLAVDPAIFEAPARGAAQPQAMGAQRPDPDMTRTLDRICDGDVRARLEDLLRDLDRRASGRRCR